MSISVVIPTYNSEKFIHATLNSVLMQSVQPDEILVLDDGSTDNTLFLLNSFKPQITVFKQKNQGVANARNELCKLAKGELIAFIDHDDLWHPSYLEVQCKLQKDYPQAVAYFTGHINFYGYENYIWRETQLDNKNNAELIPPLNFFRRYNQSTGQFASMSYCTIPKRVLVQMGKEPFCVSGVDDSYLCNVLALLGPVLYFPLNLVAYRIIKESQSTNKLKDFGLWVEVFKLLEERFRSNADTKLYREFKLAFASKRRQYVKRLMGAGNKKESRQQIWQSLRNSQNLTSIVKSLSLLFLTYLPSKFQPTWPPSHRA